MSRDEMAAALMEVVDGRLPKDRIALRELYNEILGWPWLEADEDQTEGTGEAVANYEGITPTGAHMCQHREGSLLPPSRLHLLSHMQLAMCACCQQKEKRLTYFWLHCRHTKEV